ncbi:MAG: hypothetical protein JNK20_13625 [Flavipsychrobacter sp.]|nr:hypothetical protein [Flavipsychrobacter sp.]
MLTNRLQLIKRDILDKRVKSFSDTELLKVLERLDGLEDIIATSQTSPPESRFILEMIVKPASKECAVCGRTLD